MSCSRNFNNEGTRAMSKQALARFVPSDTGPSYWGPGDRYIFLATGAQTNGAYFPFEAIVPPGGGPPPHFHRREEEGFYIIEGTLDVTMGDQHIMAFPSIRRHRR